MNNQKVVPTLKAKKMTKAQKDKMLKEQNEIINNSKNILNDENILDIDFNELDENNINNLLSKVVDKSNIKKATSKKNNLYAYKTTQSQRTKLRKQRNKFINNVLLFASNNNNESLQNELNKFNEFYKENYSLNDYSVNSIASNNSDNDTLIKIKLFFAIVKRNLSK